MVFKRSYLSSIFKTRSNNQYFFGNHIADFFTLLVMTICFDFLNALFLSRKENFQFAQRFRRSLNILNNFTFVQNNDALTNFGNMNKVMT